MFDFYPEVDLTREALLEKIAKQVKKSRFEHMLRVEKAAVMLAEKYQADPHKAALAGLLHDYAKELTDAQFLGLIDKYQLDPELKDWGNNVWHGMVGIYKIREDLGLNDSEILQAIRIHTVGAAQMSRLDKIIYIADYIEEGRDFAGIDQARELAGQSLDAAVAFETARTVEFLAKNHVKIYPQTIETYNHFVPFLSQIEGKKNK